MVIIKTTEILNDLLPTGDYTKAARQEVIDAKTKVL